MKRSLCTLFAFAFAATMLTSCNRSSREVWEDTKTCSRYVGKGFRSLCGKHVDSREYSNYYQAWEQEPEFEPLADCYQPTAFEDYGVAKESPGDPGSALPGIESFFMPKGHLASIFNSIHFDTDHYSVEGGENLRDLRAVADYLAKHSNTYVFIEGHADERGAAAYNLALGSRRANSVRSFLIQNGASPDQLFTISYGKEKPIAMGQGETTWSKNRRAQFKIYEK